MNFTLHFYQIRILTIITIDPFKREICIFAKKRKKKKKKKKTGSGLIVMTYPSQIPNP